MAKTYKHLAVESEGDAVVLRLLDAKLFETLIVSELQDDLVDYVETETPTNVVISFESVKHCSTAVINGLLRAKKRLMASGGSLKLAAMDDAIREAYRMLNLDGTVFKIYDTRREAVAACGTPGNGRPCE